MEINVNKMIEQQDKLNKEISQQVPIKDDEELIVYNEKVLPTKTNIVEHDGSILLTRYMFNNIYKVEFELNVKVVDIIPYMELSDKMFIKCSARNGIDC